MNVLAVIPARSGSKRIPAKNTRALGGRPLIAWSITEALKSRNIARVIVSTDDYDIAATARAWGADVPFMRPKELATDDAPGVSPALHAIDQLPAYDWIMLLQPTSPMRTAHDIDVAIELAALGSSPAFVSVSATRGNSSWLYYLERSGAMQPIMGWDASTRQEAQQLAYVPNGAVYLADCSWLGRSQSFITPETMGFVMPAERSIDIDTELDWHLAEFLLQRLSK